MNGAFSISPARTLFLSFYRFIPADTNTKNKQRTAAKPDEGWLVTRKQGGRLLRCPWNPLRPAPPLPPTSQSPSSKSLKHPRPSGLNSKWISSPVVTQADFVYSLSQNKIKKKMDKENHWFFIHDSYNFFLNVLLNGNDLFNANLFLIRKVYKKRREKKCILDKTFVLNLHRIIFFYSLVGNFNFVKKFYLGSKNIYLIYVALGIIDSNF